MPLFLVVIVVAIVAGYLLGGRFRRFEQLRLRWWGLAPLGLAMQLAPVPSGSGAWRVVGVSLLISSFPVLIAFVVRNLRIAGFPVILVGLVLNVLVISVNQGMPVTREAIETSGQERYLRDLPREHGTKHFLAAPEDIRLEPLADVIALGGPFSDVVSVGDCFVYAGMAWLIVAAMRGRPTLRGRRAASAASVPS
jgi:hypothetical protein